MARKKNVENVNNKVVSKTNVLKDEHNNYFGVNHYKVKIVKKKENPIQFIVGVISYALFIFLLLVGALLLVYYLDIRIRASKGDFTPSKFNGYVVLTGSMEPNIMTNDVVITKKVEAEKLKVGDVITFKSTDARFYGMVITHRIIDAYRDPTTLEYSYRTKGDYNNVADTALVYDENILGKVILKIPKLGYVQYFLARQGGWIFVILIPCLIVISADILKLIKTVGRKSKIIRK